MRWDIIVVGGSAVGASLARAARGLRIALVASAKPPVTAVPDASFDARVYALSPGSVEFLRSLDVWQSIPAERITPIYSMRVFGDAESSIEFDAYRAGVAELAWTVEDRELQAALWRALETQDDLDIIAPARCEGLELGDAARLTIAGGSVFVADLVVGADGAESFVRTAAGIGVTKAGYGQTAVVANFACELPHGNAAMQWFQRGPVLALLPLPGNRVSMVWSLPDEQAARLTELNAQEVAHEVGAATNEVLGPLVLETPLQAFPLQRQSAARLVLPHLALAGDAAHVIHPLAGQGLNLGFQDASLLGKLLVGREAVRSAGDLQLLRRYERGRSEDILAMCATVHGLHSLFGAGGTGARLVRNLGLN